MERSTLRPISVSIIVLICVLLRVQPSLSQSADSVSTPTGGALQFQLIGGLGLYYIDQSCPGSFWRVGADVSLSHSSNSGSGAHYSAYSYSQGYTTTTASDDKTTRFDIAVSGVYAREIAGYANAVLYGGAGPMVSYVFEKFTGSSTSTSLSGSPSYPYDNTNDETSKSWGVGPLLLLGVKDRVFHHVSLSAEVSLSALYRWSSTTSGSMSTSYSYPPPVSISTYGDHTEGHGWDITLSSIRIGAILEL